MMFFAIAATDAEGTLAQRLEARAAHVARLKTLQEEGRLLVAGPHPAVESEDPGAAGFTGSLIIAEFPSLADARAWVEADPYVIAGVYKSVDVRPFRKALP